MAFNILQNIFKINLLYDIINIIKYEKKTQEKNKLSK
jgi:hypothetical protein